MDLFIARRLSSVKGGRANRVMVRVATLSVAIGTMVMLITLCIIMGFKKEISSKVTGFGGDIQIVHLDGNVSLETEPIGGDQPFIDRIRSLSYVTGISRYAIKAGIMKTDEAMQGVMLKGVDSGYNWDFFRKNLIDGGIPDVADTVRNKDVLLSRTLAQLMKLTVGDKFEMLFIGDNAMTRRDRFKVKGIYDTQLPEFDRITVLTDIRNVQRLNEWDASQVTGFEIAAGHLKMLEKHTEEINEIIFGYPSAQTGNVIALSIRERYPNIFDWIEVQDINIIIIMTIMLLVSGLTMIAMVLIILLERVSMIGMLKAMGMRNGTLQRIFLIRSSYVVLKGILFGNIAGLLLCWLQYSFGWMKLNSMGYFLTVVPVYFDWGKILLLNVCSFVILVLLQLLPTLVISRISPQKTIKYE